MTYLARSAFTTGERSKENLSRAMEHGWIYFLSSLSENTIREIFSMYEISVKEPLSTLDHFEFPLEVEGEAWCLGVVLVFGLEMVEVEVGRVEDLVNPVHALELGSVGKREGFGL